MRDRLRRHTLTGKPSAASGGFAACGAHVLVNLAACWFQKTTAVCGAAAVCKQQLLTAPAANGTGCLMRLLMPVPRSLRGCSLDMALAQNGTGRNHKTPDAGAPGSSDAGAPVTDRTVSPDRQDRQGRTAPLHWQGRMNTLRKEYSSTNSAPAPAGQEGRTGQARQEWQTGQDREGGLDEQGRTVFPGRQGGSDMPDRQGIQSRQVRLGRLNTQSSPVEAFFFDLDGTLADTLPQLAKAAQDTMRCLKLRVPETDEVRSYIGNGIDNLIARCLLQDAKASASDADTAVLRRCRQVYNEVYAKGLSQNFTVYQGVEAALKRLKAKGLALAVVTNKPQVFAGPLIGFMGLAGYFDLILGSESGTARKPSPEPLLYAAKKFSTVPGRTVMVGDSDNDILAAHNAGAHSVFMTYGYYRGEPETLKPDYCLDSMLTLPDLAW